MGARPPLSSECGRPVKCRISGVCFTPAMCRLDRSDRQRELDWFGQRLRVARRQAGISQRQLASMAGVAQSTVSRAERGLLRGLRLELVASMLWCLRPTQPW
ncbi:MAG: helix-turn-helix domain-containing protein [Candidatus Limnocylindrales bacterium]